MAMFKVMCPLEGEYEKYVKDRTHQMQEKLHSEMDAPNESVAQARLQRGIISQDYPKGSRIELD